MYIQKLANGKFLARVYLGIDPQTRKRADATKCFENKDEAKAWAQGLEGDRARGKATPQLSTDTLESYLKDTWLPLYRTKIEKRNCSTYNMESRLGKWIFRVQPGVKPIGRTKMKDLRAIDLTTYYGALERTGMSFQSIRNLHSILHRALQYAFDQDLLMTNPAAKAALPEPQQRAPDEEEIVECLTAEQAQRLVKAASTDPFGAFWILLLNTGLRPGEAKALEWKHIDVAQRRITVRQALIHLHTPAERKKEGGLNWRIKLTKTKAVRTVPVSKDTIDVLLRWRREHPSLRFVFAQADGQPLGPNLSCAWARVMRAADGGRGDLGVFGTVSTKRKEGPQADPKFSIYTCRHTFATLAYENGVSIEVIAQLLGNSVEICRKHYVRREREPSTQAAELLQRLFA